MLKIAWNAAYAHPLPPKHRFPMLKYELLPEQLLYEGTVTETNFFSPGPIPEETILDTHTPAYWHRLRHLQLSPPRSARPASPSPPPS